MIDYQVIVSRRCEAVAEANLIELFESSLRDVFKESHILNTREQQTSNKRS